jgi:hypothetical protein
MPTGLRWTAASLLTLGALLHAVAAAVPSFFERELDLYWDLPHLPNLLALYFDATGPVRFSGTWQRDGGDSEDGEQAQPAFHGGASSKACWRAARPRL